MDLKDGIIEGDPDLVPVERIARMKGVAEIRADLAGMLASAYRRLGGAICGPIGSAAACIKTLAEKAGSAEQEGMATG